MSKINRCFLSACESGDIKTVNNMIDEKVNKKSIYYIIDKLRNEILDINIKDPDGNTALIIATKNYKVDIVEILLKNGALVDSINNNKTSAIEIATRNSFVEIVDKLIQYGACKEHCDISYKAVSSRNVLFKNDANIMFLFNKNIITDQDNHGDTLLMRICNSHNYFYGGSSRHNPMMKDFINNATFLYEKGADFNLVNNGNKSALDMLSANDGISQHAKSIIEKTLLENDITEDDEFYISL